MRMRSALALAAVMSVAAVGCYRHTYTFGKGGDVDKDPTESRWQSHWLFALIGEDDVRIDRICPTWDATIQNEMTFLNGLIYWINFGIIYAPTTVHVWCAEEGAPAEQGEDEGEDEDDDREDEYTRLRLTPEQLRRIALHPETLRWARSVSPAKAAELRAAVAAYRARQNRVASRSVADPR